jgi:putative MATE family efflux protein
MAYISRSLGAQEYEKAGRIFSIVVFFGLIVSALITVLGISQLKPLLEIIGKNSRAIAPAYRYGIVIVWGVPIMMFNLILSQCARAEGNPNIAMYSQLTGALLNIGLDPIFIFALKMGISGAAVATVICSAIGFFILLFYFLSPKSHLKFSIRQIRPSLEIINEIGKSGIPSFTRHIAASIVATLTNSLLARYGAFALAIMGINNRLIMFFFMPIVGTGQGFMPIVGYNYGARNLPRVKKTFWTTVKLATIICILGWILIQWQPELFIKIFSSDPKVVGLGVPSLRVINTLLPLLGFQIIGSYFYQAIGKGLAGFILSIARQVTVFLPLVLIFRIMFGLDGIFFAFPAADLGATLITAIWLRHTLKEFSSTSLPPRPTGREFENLTIIEG